MVAHKRYRKLELLNFVTITVRTDPPRAAPTWVTVNVLLTLIHMPTSLILIVIDHTYKAKHDWGVSHK